jgi:metal-responsive CopG/Arc/MetJ family transcriptional regulator
MKTAISVPQDTFDRADRVAKERGMTRSAFFAAAADHYAADLEAESVTSQINAALDLAGEDDATEFARELGHRMLRSDDEDW